MSTAELFSAEVVVQRFRPTPEAAALLKLGMNPAGYIHHLVEAGLYRDALAVAACSLPRREAVWWGCLCIWHAFGERLSQKEQTALATAVRWVIDPKDESRQLAVAAAGTVGSTSTPVGALASAVGWSGGSMTPPELPAVAPPEFLTQNAVAAGMLAAASQARPSAAGDVCRQFLELALDVATGKNRWEASAGPA